MIEPKAMGLIVHVMVVLHFFVHEQRAEGVVATNFFWLYTGELQNARRRHILSLYPEIKDLFGPEPWAFLKFGIKSTILNFELPQNSDLHILLRQVKVIEAL